MAETGKDRLPVYTTTELSGLSRENLNQGEIVRVSGDSLAQILFVADRICQALGLRAGEGRKSLEKLIGDAGFSTADIRPQSVFGISIGRLWTNREEPDKEKRKYRYTLTADNRNARSDRRYTDQLQEAVDEALDPDKFKFDQTQ